MNKLTLLGIVGGAAPSGGLLFVAEGPY